MVVDVLRGLAAERRADRRGNTDVAVADFDYAAAFPWMTDGVPDAIVDAAEWAHDALGEERHRLAAPAPRRSAAADRRRHARPRLPRLAGLADRRVSTSDLDPSVTIERVARTDARVIVCGHTHLPEVRDLGWKVIVNDGLRGLRVRRRPDRLVGARSTSTMARSAPRSGGPTFDTLAVANAISARGLAGDVYRAATVRTGKLVR